jgi:hypothetical protein
MIDNDVMELSGVNFTVLSFVLPPLLDRKDCGCLLIPIPVPVRGNPTMGHHSYRRQGKWTRKYFFQDCLGMCKIGM